MKNIKEILKEMKFSDTVKITVAKADPEKIKGLEVRGSHVIIPFDVEFFKAFTIQKKLEDVIKAGIKMLYIREQDATRNLVKPVNSSRLTKQEKEELAYLRANPDIRKKIADKIASRQES